MPYIAQQRRKELANYDRIRNAGELNFVVTELAIKYLKDNGKRYQTINDILGALEGAKLEFYRRVAVDYENDKIAENGDVY